MKKITISEARSNFEREKLIRPFGFKGGYMTEIWQTISYLKSENNYSSLGLCSQSVLWSDANVFTRFSEGAGNSVMYAMADYGLHLLKGQSYTEPVSIMNELWKEVYDYGKKITMNEQLRETFALNALVGVDNALWLLYARENGIKTFDEMIPEAFKPAVSNKNKVVASIPLVSYALPVSEVKELVEQGYYFMKIKLGQPGTQEEMLEKDIARLTEIHKAIGHYTTTFSHNGKIPYYFDANGRYQKKETLLKFLRHAEKIGAIEQIALIEEPFPEELKIDVNDVPVRLAADESAHTDKDALERIEMGYKAIALKAIAKTLSMTLKIADVAHKHNIPCFCADLTVNPILVDWNKNIAARLAPFPGLGSGLLETNGNQNYNNWRQMESYHPYQNASWRFPVKGAYQLDDDFYAKSGGIFENSDHYCNLV